MQSSPKKFVAIVASGFTTTVVNKYDTSGPRHSEVEEALKRGCLAVEHDVPVLPKKPGAKK